MIIATKAKYFMAEKILRAGPDELRAGSAERVIHLLGEGVQGLGNPCAHSVPLPAGLFTV